MNNWLIDYINNDKDKGKYISFRQKIIVICTLIISFAAGKIMDLNNNKYLNYLIIYSIALIIAVIEVVVLFRIDDSAKEVKDKYEFKMSIFLNCLLKDKAFLYYLFYVTLFYLALYMSDSFTMLYMMKYLNFSYIQIVFIQMLMTLPQIGLLSITGKMIDKYGSQRVLNLSIWFFAGETLFLALSNLKNGFICVSFAFLIASVANSGFTVSAFSRRYEIIPEEGRMIYDSFYGAFIGLAFILGPLIGGSLKNIFSNNMILKETMQFADIRLLYIISTICILLIQVIFSFSRYFRTKKTFFTR